MAALMASSLPPSELRRNWSILFHFNAAVLLPLQAYIDGERGLARDQA
jgi:hypothetical protein